VKRFLSDDHFSVDGTLVEAWASLKSFGAKDGSDEPPSPSRNGERDFHGEKRADDTRKARPTRTRSYSARASRSLRNSTSWGMR
jgi:hypothetical protein